MNLTFVDFELDQLRSYYSKGGSELATVDELTAYIEAPCVRSCGRNCYGYRLPQEVPKARIKAFKRKCGLARYFKNLEKAKAKYGIVLRNM